MGCIIGIVIITVVGFVIQLFVYWMGGWGAVVAILALGAIGVVIFKIVDTRDQRRADEDKKRVLKAKAVALLQRHINEQQGVRKEMTVIGKQSIRLFEELPKHLISAEKYMDQAEVDYAESAFAPFWDSIENAVKMLGLFDEYVRHIEDGSSRYTELIKNYKGTPPDFPLARQSVAKLVTSKATAERMKALVRKAQRNFQFAMIYEQRKTNVILVAGFTNLAQALDRMTGQLTASINDLARSVAAMSSTLDKSMRNITEKMSQYHEELMGEASEFTAREEKALEMLDNIQRRRRPSL